MVKKFFIMIHITLNLKTIFLQESHVIGVSDTGHTDNITCVRCIEDKNSDNPLVALSTSSDGTACLWKLNKLESNNVETLLTTITVLKGKIIF